MIVVKATFDDDEARFDERLKKLAGAKAEYEPAEQGPKVRVCRT